MKKTIAALVLAAFLAGCGGYSTGTVQKTEKGFLKFTGKVEAVMISVDGGAQFRYDRMIDAYEVPPGTHAVRVYRNNQIVVDRLVVVDNHTTFEIEVP